MAVFEWLKQVGDVLKPRAASLADPVPVQMAGFAFDGDFIVDLDRTVTAVAATIANAGSLSGAADVSAGRIVGLQLPAAWTAAPITFQGSIDGGATYSDVYDDGVERTIAAGSVVASRVLPLDGDDWRAFTHVKIRSGTAASPVAQGAQRVFGLAVEGGV